MVEGGGATSGEESGVTKTGLEAGEDMMLFLCCSAGPR